MGNEMEEVCKFLKMKIEWGNLAGREVHKVNNILCALDGCAQIEDFMGFAHQRARLALVLGKWVLNNVPRLVS